MSEWHHGPHVVCIRNEQDRYKAAGVSRCVALETLQRRRRQKNRVYQFDHGPGQFAESDCRKWRRRNPVKRCQQNADAFDPNRKLPLSNSSHSTSCRGNCDKSNPCQELSLWVSHSAVMDCSSWVMICQSREILIFPELHQVAPHCHCPCEILMAIIWDSGGPAHMAGDLGDDLLHPIL